MPPASSDEQAGNFHGASIDVTPGNHDQNRKDRDSRVPDADRSGRAPAESCERRSSVSVQELPTFGRTDFQVGGMVGQGSFATVHKARHIGSGRSVVLKVVRPESELDFGTGPNGSTPAVCYRDVLRAMKKEVSLMMSLGTTKHVVQVLGTAEDCRVLVMERAVSDLYTIIKQQGLRLPLGHAKLWAGHMIAAIDFIHSMGVVHQDIKSSNVIVFPDRTAKLCDFGLAKKGQDIMVVDRELITLWYRAPELLMGDDTYTPKVDEWGVGCVLLEMMIGVPPFKGKPECVCSCSQITHRNFNSDQLMKIFLCLGSPEKKSTLPCSNHFGRWPTFPRKLESTLRRVITHDRIVTSSGKPATLEELEVALVNWTQLIASMLELQPRQRVRADHALRMPVFVGGSAESGSVTPEDLSASGSGRRRSPVQHDEDGSQVGGRRGSVTSLPRIVSGEMLNRSPENLTPSSRAADARAFGAHSSMERTCSPGGTRYSFDHPRNNPESEGSHGRGRRQSVEWTTSRQGSKDAWGSAGTMESQDGTMMHGYNGPSPDGGPSSRASSGCGGGSATTPKGGKVNTLLTSFKKRVETFMRTGSSKGHQGPMITGASSSGINWNDSSKLQTDVGNVLETAHSRA
mmetsp:Transcript_18069/g.35298  ORF Transcript_18069/g.35298 Transcript_18069/m.35298 type:complete len:629 (+) Transcript_18069:153-2039(+)|eukprot:CAMPEP_0173389596 /NCGR_PEP_ID=MMETSP1356-20130122/12661_1 /TAXON_ID=77927 ORGANISM="Hemiselmis virescens, Strain PCC157" /NCGR_SAMPLE_ID=MMETSP1356 /ASSEMBLY_ACC=CAM_ASM_000847 /LENGTH=628 /DNA_ID=CAMNT_0014346801 /DNA_START=134 /DNA_END=2020 /DNA_ORIENTATION=+